MSDKESAIEAVADLQGRVAFIDLIASGRTRSGNEPEFLLLKRRNIKVKMYQETGHKIPHVHIDYGPVSHVASYAVNPVERLAGDLDKKYEREIVTWIELNRDLLVKIWDAVQSSNDPALLVAALAGDA
jgi:hypothetical protein